MLLSKVAARAKAPVEVASDPGLHRHNVFAGGILAADMQWLWRDLRDDFVQVCAEGGETSFISLKLVGELLEMHSDVVRGGLKVKALLPLQHGENIVGQVAHGLLHVVRVNVLK